MRLDGKSIQAAISQMVEEYRFDAYQIFEIVKMWIRSGFRKDFPEFKKANIVVNIANDWWVNIYKQLLVKSENEIEDPDTEIWLKDAKARIPVTKTAMEKAQENYDITSGRYKVGYGDVIELKDASVALANAKLNYFQTIYEYNSARANLEKSIGQTLKSESSEEVENFQEL